MRSIVIGATAVILASCGSSSDVGDPAPTATPSPGAAATSSIPPAAALPDLAACPARAPVDEGLRQRTRQIPVPPPLHEIMRSDMDNFAIATLGGATVCVDASWMEDIRVPALSDDKRFASFDWQGYEAFGHIVVDRNGKGVAIDTGTPPVASPSGKLLAAVDLGEAAFGALNAFAVWQADGLRQLAKQDDVPQSTDWRIERWASEDCVELSAVPWEQSTGAANDPRQAYFARAGKRWRLEPGRCPAA
jgi:hypothetical protein